MKFSLNSVKHWGNDQWDIQKLTHHVKLCSRDYTWHYRFSHDDWLVVKKQLAAEIEKHKLHKA